MEKEKISGKPSKLFFIDMLTRDITVSDAIGDLVDNAVDAARKRIFSDQNKSTIDLFSLKYENTNIYINFSENEFSIKDNAGGIPFETARDYAFCFGRPEIFDGTPSSIGQFGIGMKRAFFKIGKKISIESSTEKGYFKIEIDVDKWKNDDKNWDFDLTDKRDECDIEIGYGTKITIKDLNESSKALFKATTYTNSLIKEIEIENWYNISKGIKIKINNIDLKAKDLSIKEDSSIGLVIGKWQHNYDGVDVRIFCGIGDKGKKEDGGWYIFCNDRLILAAEQTAITGWTGRGRKVNGNPEYHGQYERFRGFVFFESENPSNFPWNTAKTGLNPEHPLYIKVKEKMSDMMRDVISFLNKIKTERDGQGRGKSQQLSETEQKLEKSQSLPLREIAVKTVNKITKFTAPETIKVTKEIPRNNMVNIFYEVDIEQFDAVSKHIGTNDVREVGLKTFNYYLDNET